ncbi:MAG: rod-binding protein [Deltaproteobacteria bacterium]|nr:rod-binding protein [Deltaproteobacteria bacterium]
MSIRLETLSDLVTTRVPEDREAATEEAAVGMEALFLRHMLAEMRKGTDGGFLSGGQAGSMFRSMLDEAMADIMAQAGGIGLASAIEEQLNRKAEARSPQVGAAVRAYTAQATEFPRESEKSLLLEETAQGSSKAVETKLTGGR